MTLDYLALLFRRAKHAQPRNLEEDVATVIDLYNYDALRAWRYRWSSKASYPPTWTGYMAKFFFLYLGKERAEAKIFLEKCLADKLAARLAARKNSNVLTLKGIINRRIR